ncbi:MAG TPA: DUF6586 family protein [Spongiibacteraceae bacterium]|jgi:hypothetical protein
MNTRVDQKLYFAKLAFAAADMNSAAETALLEAVLFHLHIAYRSYLRELLDNINQSLSADTAQQAAQQLRILDINSPDIEELAKLEQSGDWPAQLQAAYHSAAATVAEIAPAATGTIAVADITAQIDRVTSHAWLQQFHALVQRQRNHAQEW